MLYTATEYRNGPIALRFPRGAGVGVALAATGFTKLPIGRGEMLKDGERVAIVGVGPILRKAMKAAEDLDHAGISTAVFNARFVKPLDRSLLDAIAARFTHVLTLEENTIVGGLGAAVAEYYAATGAHVSLRMHGLPDRFIEHGAPAALLSEVGLDAAGIAAAVRELVTSSVPHTQQVA